MAQWQRDDTIVIDAPALQRVSDAWRALDLPVVCISLQEREDRYVRARDECRRVGLAPLVRYYRPVRDRSTHVAHPGMRGCWESHRAVARWAIEQRHERVLVLEDDVCFVQPFTREHVRRIHDALRALRTRHWSALYLGVTPLLSVPSGWCAQLWRTWGLCLHAYVMNAPLRDWLARTSFDAANRCAPGQRDAPPLQRARHLDHYTLLMPRMYALAPMLAFQNGSSSDNKTLAPSLCALTRWTTASRARKQRVLHAGQHAAHYGAPLLVLIAVGVLLALCVRRSCAPINT